MSLSYFRVLMAISLVLLPLFAKGDDHVPPSLAPFYDELCKEVECGKGSCEAAPGSAFNFKCNCDNGWKRTRLDNEDDLEFLPCIIPDCDVNYSCMPAPPPLPSNPHNTSVFDRAIGSNSCEKLGIKSSSSTSNPSPNDNNNNQAAGFSLGNFNWMPVLLATTALAFWK